MPTERMTAQQYRSLTKAPGGGKYNTAAKPERTWSGVWQGHMQTIVFDSKFEMHRFCELRVMEQNGLILNLIIQPKFSLTPSEIYKGDFKYLEPDGKKLKWVCEDVKGHETQLFRSKWKRVVAMYPIEFRLVTK